MRRRFDNPRFAVLIALSFAAAVPRLAGASPEMDRKYALEVVGTLRSSDNMDGLFSEMVDGVYREYFSSQNRFKVQDLTRAHDVIDRSKIPSERWIKDPEVLGQIAKSARVESLIRTRILKEGPSYSFTLDWLHPPKMDLLATQSFRVQAEAGVGQSISGEAIREEIRKGLIDLIAQIPFQAQVTGRDTEWVTVNIGRAGVAKKGDRLRVVTLEEVRRHPLLGTLVDWRTTPTGELEIDSIDDAVAFCKVVEENPQRPIARYQKVTQIVPAQVNPLALSKDKTRAELETEAEEARDKLIPRLGWMAMQVEVGSISRTFTLTGGVSGRTGSALGFGGRASGQLWLTKEFFTEAAFGYTFGSYSQKDIASGADDTGGSGSTTVSHLTFAAGYNYYVTGDLFGPRAFARLGYKSKKFSFPVATTSYTGVMSFGGVFVGVGGELPLRGPYGVQMSFDVGLFKSGTDDSLSLGTPTSVGDFSLFFGGYYRFQPKLVLRVGLDVQGNSADFLTGESVSNKVISIAPTLQYYF